MEDSELYEDANIIRHGQPSGEDSLSLGDGDLIDAVTDHFERHVATVNDVFHEIVSPYVHVDVHHIPPGAGRNHHVLFTTGMAERPMAVPEGAESYRYAELMVCLPAAWPLTETAFKDEEAYWPGGTDALIERFEKAGVSDVVDVGRPNLLARRRFWPFG